MLVVVERDELSEQALTFARGFGEPLDVLCVGEPDTEMLARHGVRTAYAPKIAGGFAPQAYGRAIAGLGATTIIAAGSDRGNELLAHAAVLAGGTLAANVIEATPGDPVAVVRQRWGGSLLEEANLHGDVKLLTVAPHAVAIEHVDGGAVTVESFAPELQAADTVAAVAEHVDTSTGGLTLAESPVVVSGGRGVGSAEGFGPLEELAEVLGGVVGCSRAVTSAGWRPHTDQVGQTGTKISPDIYIPCGISGATQHMAGCKGAKKVLAINADRDAPILANADYAVVGDLAEIVPAITAELRRVKG